MKTFVLKLIKFYQKYRPLPAAVKVCRFSPTCSAYTYGAVEKYGSLKGLFFGLKRVLRCHPWAKGGYDPVA